MAIDIYTSISHNEDIAIVGALEFTKRGMGRFMSNSFKPDLPVDSTLIAIESVLFGAENIANKYQSNTVYNKLIEQKTIDKIRKKSNGVYRSSKKRYEKLIKEFNGNLNLKKINLIGKSDEGKIHIERYTLSEDIVKKIFHYMKDNGGLALIRTGV